MHTILFVNFFLLVSYLKFHMLVFFVVVIINKVPVMVSKNYYVIAIMNDDRCKMSNEKVCFKIYNLCYDINNVHACDQQI